MKILLYATLIILFILPVQVHAQSQTKTTNTNDVAYSWIPRVSAYEAYTKYKEGKAIILHAGGQKYYDRHLVGALNYDVKPRAHLINKLPKRGIEIFTY